MSELQFCYWLKGFFEIGKPETLNKEQVQEINNHLELVFKKVTPVINDSYCQGYQKLDTKYTGNSALMLC